MAQINHITTPHNSGLGDPLATAFEHQQSMNTELYDTVVFEVPGKDLSEANFTNIEKAKLASIVTPIAPQVQSDYGQTNALAIDFIKNKKTNLSEFVNDINFIPDVDVVGNFVRQIGAWVPVLEAMPELLTYAEILTVNKQIFTMPVGAKIERVMQNEAEIVETTNVLYPKRYSKSSNVVTIIAPTTAANNRITILYRL